MKWTCAVERQKQTFERWKLVRMSVPFLGLCGLGMYVKERHQRPLMDLTNPSCGGIECAEVVRARVETDTQSGERGIVAHKDSR